MLEASHLPDAPNLRDNLGEHSQKAFRADGWTACMCAFDAQFNPGGLANHCPYFSLRMCHNAECVKPHTKPPDSLLQHFVAAWPVSQQIKKKKKKIKPAAALTPMSPKFAISKLPPPLQSRVQQALLRKSTALVRNAPAPMSHPVQMQMEPVVQVPLSRWQQTTQLEQQFLQEQQIRQSAQAMLQQCEAELAAERQLRLTLEAELRSHMATPELPQPEGAFQVAEPKELRADGWTACMVSIRHFLSPSPLRCPRRESRT